ncbi:MAG TPA: tryptophan synthase subunit alpha [Archaeoglobaceae archaeon]|nr:tryptophan synthase subunit alpha [Archaeoglobaceae archaeon]
MKAIKKVFENGKALVTFITAGDPDSEATLKFLLALEENSDIIELGIPFSDPMADGRTIQKANYRALNKGMKVADVFKIVKNFRDFSDKPIILMTYYNPVYVKGEENFVRMAKEAGVNGLIVVDLPVEESDNYVKACRKYEMGTVFLSAPNTPDDRLRTIDELSSAFVYLVSLYGTTGAREDIPQIAFDFIRRAKNTCTKPVCVGFGISKKEHVEKITSNGADGVVIGSALVKIIEKHGNSEKTVEKLKKKTKKLRAGLF